MKILPKLEVNVDGYNDENQETVPMAMFDKTVGELLAETDKVNQLTAENAKLREQLADCDVKLEEAIDMLVNVYDLGNLDEEWAGNVAMVLAKNDIDTTPVTLGEVTL